MKKIVLIIGAILFFVFILFPLFTPRTDKTSVSVNKKSKQEDFLKLFRNVLELTYNVKRITYYSTMLTTKIPRAKAYQLLKDAEEIQGKCSVLFTFQGSSIPSSLDKYKKDIEQSFDELSMACTDLQQQSKHSADYLNTGNLESLRKANASMDKHPITVITNAISRLAYGVGAKIGLDTTSLNKEYETLNEKITNDFEKEYGKPSQ